MKTIAELQQEIRSIRKELSNLDGRLNAMDTELLNYKDVTSDDSEYKRIYEIAKTMPVIKHPIVQETIQVKNNYFGMLLMVAVVDDSINEDQLMFFQRMVLSDANDQRLEHYIAALGSIVPENVLYKMDENIKQKYDRQLLLDMLIVAGLSRGNTRKAYELIVNIAAVLGLKKEELKKIALVASEILKQSVEGLPTENFLVIITDEMFGYYLSEIPGWDTRVKKALVEKMIFVLSNIDRNKKNNISVVSEEEEYGENWCYYKD